VCRRSNNQGLLQQLEQLVGPVLLRAQVGTSIQERHELHCHMGALLARRAEAIIGQAARDQEGLKVKRKAAKRKRTAASQVSNIPEDDSQPPC
jgi:hypothetical protein